MGCSEDRKTWGFSGLLCLWGEAPGPQVMAVEIGRRALPVRYGSSCARNGTITALRTGKNPGVTRVGWQSTNRLVPRPWARWSGCSLDSPTPSPRKTSCGLPSPYCQRCIYIKGMGGLSSMVYMLLRRMGFQKQLLTSGKQMSDLSGLQTVSPSSPQLGPPPSPASYWASISPLLSPASSSA